MSAVSDAQQFGSDGADGEVARPAPLTRIFGWSMLALMFAYIVNIVFSVWIELPGIAALSADGDAEVSMAAPIFQLAVYILGIVFSCLFVLKTPNRTLRDDSAVMVSVTNYIVAGAFWSVVLIGLVDMAISFLRVEGLLAAVVGEDLTTEIGRSRFRGPYIHIPLIVLGYLIPLSAQLFGFPKFGKTLGFQWLALLVVIAELFIVLSRFVFSYEQAFQGDLVRFWYGSLFLFASAYTLFEDGHVRVDVLYSGFTVRRKGLVNAVGSLVLGLSLCWTILIFAMWDKSSIVNSALLTFEVSQSGFGMYVKYWMAAFLAIFAISMAIQFISYFLESVADRRGDPGHREPPVMGH
ncbi:MAG: TRAP transporter small permease subunit [Alphaproteobacteria bacterium]